MRYLLLIMICAGCATSAKFNTLSLGMTKNEVLQKLGAPESDSINEKGEYLKYDYDIENKYVFLKDGKVARFGNKWAVVDKEDRGPSVVPTVLIH